MKQSAGILLYQIHKKSLQVLLVHPGGPFWAKKDGGAWTIPKGEFEENEEPLTAAKREFEEETGQTINGSFIPLKSLKQKSGKLIHAWAAEGIMDVTHLKSNTFEMPWPPKSGKIQSFPEVDKAQWFNTEEAHKKIIPGQAGFITELEIILTQKGLTIKK